VTWLLRFFHAADPMPIWLGVMVLSVAAYAVSIVAADPRSVDEALAVLLLLQMMAASAGFSHPAAAGHFDQALVRARRGSIALAHLLHAASPLALAWCGLAILELLLYDNTRAFELGRISAFVFVSVTCWALSLPGPRLVAGILWLVLIVSSLTTSAGTNQYAAMLARTDGTAQELAHATLLVLVCPFLMLGDHVPPRTGASVILLFLSLVTVLIAVRYLTRRDYPLEAAS